MSQHFTDGRNVQTLLSARERVMAPMNFCEKLPERIRVSLGSAVILGLEDIRLDAAPTTAYLMTYRQEKCTANCGFCPQARASSTSSDMLSRISWPIFPTVSVLDEIRNITEGNAIKRVCIQALNYPGVFVHLEALVKMIRERTNTPISICNNAHTSTPTTSRSSSKSCLRFKIMVRSRVIPSP